MKQALGISVSQLIMIFRCTTEPFLLPVFISPVNQLCPMTTHLEEPKKRRIGHWGPITRGRLNPSDFWDPIQCVPSICPFPSDKNYWPNNISSKAGCLLVWAGLLFSPVPAINHIEVYCLVGVEWNVIRNRSILFANTK